MKKIINKIRSIITNSKGFTLIELLVVIGILGILATALVATIDPFEQLKKGQDSNVKNTAVEYINANIRYYTTHNSLPWSNTAVTDCMAGSALPFSGQTLNAMTGCVNALISDGELKSGFSSVTSILTSIIVAGSSNGVTSCFNPQSKSQDRDPNTKFDANGALTTGCVAQTSANTTVTSCYWCSQ